jgi:RNAse (barnase) inhibitor barstar
MTKTPTIKALQGLLTQPKQAGIYHLPHHGQTGLTKAAKALGFACFKVDFEESEHMGAILTALGQALHFPDWYGANFDALNDCLTDLSWREAPGYMLVIQGADAVHATANSFNALNEVLTNANEEWRGRDVPFWIFYDLRADGIATLPTLA